MPPELGKNHYSTQDAFDRFENEDDIEVDHQNGIVILIIRTIVKNKVKEIRIPFRLEKDSENIQRELVH